MQIKTTMRYHYTLIRMSKIWNSDNSKCWLGSRAIGTLIDCQWGCKMVLWNYCSILFSYEYTGDYLCLSFKCNLDHTLQFGRTFFTYLYIKNVISPQVKYIETHMKDVSVLL